MTIDVVIPKLGMTMQEGTLVEWLQPDGAAVEVGDPIFVLNTDKLDAEIEAEAAGTLRHVAAAGDTLPTGALLGVIESEGGTAKPTSSTAPAASPNAPAPSVRLEVGPAAPLVQPPAISPNARRLSRELGVSLAGLHGSGAGGRIIGRDVEVAAEQPRSDQEPPATGPSSLPRASFAARRAAASLGIDLAQVVPAASNNEITRQDVERAAAHVIQAHDRPSARSRVAPSPTRPDDGPAVVPLAGMRRVIATRMHASLQEMAQLTIGMEARADKLVALRTDLKRAWTLLDRPVPTFTDMIASAVAKVLPHHRRVNAVVTPNSIELLDAVHIGIAVALPDGLVVPVVRDADRLSLAELAEQSARLVALARAGALSIDDMNGATFSVTSLGGFGVDFFTPVINPPNVAILGVGRIRDGVRVTKKGRVRAARWLTLSLTFDHRAVDGAPAAEFLRDVCEVLEAPATLLS